MSMEGPRYLSPAALDSLELSTTEVVESIEALLRSAKQSRAWSAPKPVIKPPDGRYLMATLSAADDPPFMAVKALLLNPRNPERGLSSINSLVVLQDGDTGLPLAVIDGNWITAVRTAGLSAVAAKRLANPRASTIAFIGCGVQAQSHLRALVELFPLKEVRAFGRGAANRDALCRTAERRGLAAIAAATARDAISAADIVVSSVPLTPRPDPFVDARWLKPGAFATLPDLALPWLRDSMGAFARIVIDDREQEATMPEPMVEPQLVSGDLADLVAGSVAEVSSRSERTAFVFRGMGLADLALAALAYQRASGGVR
ncbi:MAG TPA: NAD(P)-binding domain-containing protein [Burkholderiales bacterium]|nr:NAD(P)-binding domain-containing protein [Burkholderiales bacterium]